MVAIQCLLQGHSPLGKLSMWVVLKRNKYSYLLNYSELKVSRWVCLLMQCSSLFEPTVRISWGKNVEITSRCPLAALPSKAFHKSFVALTFSESALRCTCVRVWGGASRTQFSFSTWIPGYYYTQEQVPLPLVHLSAAPPPTSGLSPDWTWTSCVAEDNLDLFCTGFFLLGHQPAPTELTWSLIIYECSILAFARFWLAFFFNLN